MKIKERKEKWCLWLKHGIVYGDRLLMQEIYYWLRWKITGKKLILWKVTPHYVVVNEDFLKKLL